MIYIIKEEKYRTHYKEGIFKYLPEFLIPKLKPRILDNIYSGENQLGNICGINLKPINYEIIESVEEYIQSINKIKNENHSILILENHKDLTEEIKEMIEIKTHMQLATGEILRNFNLPIIIKDIYNILGKDLKTQEILIICRDKEKTKKIIRTIYTLGGFITHIGLGEQENQEIYEIILEETGLSLFQALDIDKIIKEYNLIINMENSIEFNMTKVRKNTIIFDFSWEKPFRKLKRSGVSGPIIIEDFIFRKKDLDIENSPWIDNKIDSAIYESLSNFKKQVFHQISFNNNYYYLRDYINTNMRIKGGI